MFTIDNKFKTARIKIFYIIILTSMFAFGIYLIFEPNKMMVKYVVAGILACLTIAYLLMLFLRLNYFFIQDNGDFILVRFYSAHPFLRKYKAFKFPVSALKSYQIKKSFFNLKKEISIKAQNHKGEFLFPTLSLSLLSDFEIEELKKILDKYL